MSAAPTPTRILMIEDDLADAELLTEMLSDEKSLTPHVEVAERLADAVRKLDETDFDVIVSDLNLPDSRGLETFSEIQKHAGKLPILVMSGLDDENTALEAVRLGAQDYLVKGRVNGALLAKTILYSIERNRSSLELKRVNDELQSANQRLERLAHNDALTDLLNRRGLQEILHQETARSRRDGTNLICLLIDLDDFKRINDTISHSAGDSVLKEVAARMRKPLRETDHAARVGGDEFLILLPGTLPAEGMKIAEVVRSRICDTPIDAAGKMITATASVGVISVPREARTIDDLLAETHNVLYRSKRRGKNRVSFDEGGEENPESAAFRVLEDLKRDMSFTAFYQPILRLIDNHPVGMEIVARSSTGDPNTVDDLMKMGVDKETLMHMERKCLNVCAEAAHHVPRSLRRHVNLSPSALTDIVANAPIEMLAGQGSPFCIEISQNAIVGDPSYLTEPLDKLKRAGVLTAIEDVSFGKNSLESLVLLEPDFAKIDRAYIIGIAKDPARLRSLGRILKLAESLGMEVIAEGIETAEDLGALRSAGVKFGQGFNWGQPSPDLAGLRAILPEMTAELPAGRS